MTLNNCIVLVTISDMGATNFNITAAIYFNLLTIMDYPNRLMSWGDFTADSPYYKYTHKKTTFSGPSQKDKKCIRVKLSVPRLVLRLIFGLKNI